MDSIVSVSSTVIDSGIVADTVAKVAQSVEVAGMTINGSLLVSATGMLIVFAALAGIAVIISQLPALMKVVAKIVPEPAPAGPKKAVRKQANTNDDDAIAVAIALANHTAKGK